MTAVSEQSWGRVWAAKQEASALREARLSSGVTKFSCEVHLLLVLTVNGFETRDDVGCIPFRGADETRDFLAVMIKKQRGRQATDRQSTHDGLFIFTVQRQVLQAGGAIESPQLLETDPVH